MDSFKILVSDFLISRVGDPLIVLGIVAVAIIAVTAVFVGIELKKNGRGEKDA